MENAWFVIEKKSMIVSDNTIKAEGLGLFLKNLGKISAEASKKLATNALKNPAGFLEINANVATAAASKNPKTVSTVLPEVIKFYHRGKGVYLGKFVYFIPYKWKRKQVEYTHMHH